jgi:hypothetical protein
MIKCLLVIMSVTEFVVPYPLTTIEWVRYYGIIVLVYNTVLGSETCILGGENSAAGLLLELHVTRNALSRERSRGLDATNVVMVSKQKFVLWCVRDVTSVNGSEADKVCHDVCTLVTFRLSGDQHQQEQNMMVSTKSQRCNVGSCYIVPGDLHHLQFDFCYAKIIDLNWRHHQCSSY